MGKQKHFVTLFIGSGMNIILSLITTPIITRLVVPEVYGNYSLFTVFGNIFLIAACLGQDQAYGRFFYAHDEVDYERHVLKLVAKIPLTIAMIAGLGLLAYYVMFDHENFLLPIISMYMLVLVLERFGELTLRLKMKSFTYSILINLQKLTYTGFVVIAVCYTNINHLYILTGCTVLSHLVVSLIAVKAEKKLWKKNLFHKEKIEKYNKEVCYRDIFKYSWPLIFASICTWIFTGADKVMLKMFSTSAEVGIYASAVSIVGVFSIITTTFNLIWSPIALEQYEKEPENTEFFQKAADNVAILLFGAGGTIVLLKDVVIYFLGADYRTAVFLVPFLSLQPVMYTISEATCFGINFKKKTEYHLYFSVICCLINIALNYFLILKIGAIGAAIATGITYTIFLILRTFFSMKCYPVKYQIGKMSVMTILYYIFIIYNSIYTINLVSILMYCVLATVGIVLYRQALKDLIGYMKDYYVEIKKKLSRKA